MVYLSSRRFLPLEHDLRTIGRHAVNGLSYVDCETRERPMKRTPLRCLSCIEAIVASEEKNVSVQGVKGPCCSEGLVYAQHQVQFYAQDSMHSFGNVGKEILGLLKGKRGSDAKSKAFEKSVGRFKSWSDPPPVPGDASKKERSAMASAAKPPWTLSTEEQNTVDYRINSLVRMPPNCDKVGKILKYLSSAKTSHIFTFMRSLAAFAFNGVGNPVIVANVLRLFAVLSLLCCHDVLIAEVDNLEKELAVVVSILEGLVPATIFVSTLHSLLHIPQSIRHFGPLRCFWMFPFERAMHELGMFLMNVRFPVPSMLRNYETSVLLEFWFTRDLVLYKLFADDVTNSCTTLPGQRAMRGAVKSIFTLTPDIFVYGQRNVVAPTCVVGEGQKKLHMFSEEELYALRINLGENSPRDCKYAVLYHEWHEEWQNHARGKRRTYAFSGTSSSRRRKKKKRSPALQRVVHHWRTGKWRPRGGLRCCNG